MTSPVPQPPQDPGARPSWARPGAPRLGRYWLGPELGRGGIGAVFEAWDTLLGRRIAVKTLNVPDPASILRFMREAQIQARVTHPGVCRIYDLDASTAAPFIAMQLVRGPNLLQAAPRLTLAEAVEILASVALSVQSAHRLKLIHRDLKPSNILLEPDGAGGWATFVADFGLAKELDGMHLTAASAALGTPRFMAPEQLRGEAGPGTDIFALGVTLEVVLGALREGPAPPRLRTIIGRCREERPQDRYPSAGALAEDLRRFLDGEPLLAERGQWRRLGLRWTRRHPAWAACLGLALLLGTSVAGSSRLAARGRRQAALAQRFAMDTRDMEHRMRLERLIPVHDLRPTFARMREGLERIRLDMAALGAQALGPGSLALGRGYCALGDQEQAWAALERAWNSGCRTPEMAGALSRVACERCLALSAADPARRRLREAAREYLTLSAGQTWEPAPLAEARTLYLEERFPEAVAKARQAFRDNPWMHEAKLEEARALAAAGCERQRRGDLPGALSLYSEASVASRLARTIGHSDEGCYFSDLEWRLRWAENPGLALDGRLAHLAEAERLADQVLILRPDLPRALQAKVQVQLARASALAAAGRDPEAELRRAERLLAPAGEIAGMRELAARERRQVAAVRTRFRQRLKAE